MTTLRITNASTLEHGDERTDVWIRDGRIVAPFADEPDTTIDAQGAFVAPGLIDLHAHVLPQAADLSIDADRVGVEQGVTTLVDAGSAGCRDLARLLADGAATRRTRVLAWLNIASAGLVDGRHELADPAAIDVGATVDAIEQHRDVVVGIKARMSSSVVGDQGTRPLELALEAAELAGVPIMIHTGNEPPSMSDCLDLLRPGDVVSHAFHGKSGGLMRGAAPSDAAAAAVERGVLLDVGHGEASLSFRVARAALEAGIAPHTISTDIHAGNVDGPVHSLAVTMSKMLALGIELADVVRMVTAHPAAIVGRPELGTLDVGTPADLTLFAVDDVPTTLVDAHGDTLEASRRIRPTLTITEGTAHALD